MATAEGVKTIADIVSATGQSMQQSASATVKAAGKAIELAGNYVNGISDAAINAMGGGKSNAEVFGHFLSEWLVANATTDAAILIGIRVFPIIMSAVVGIYGAHSASACASGTTSWL